MVTFVVKAHDQKICHGYWLLRSCYLDRQAQFPRLPRNNCCSHRNYIRFQILAFGEVVMRDKPNNGWVEESICRTDNWTNFLCWTRILKQIRIICLKGSAFLLSVQYPVLPCVIHAFENTKLNCSGVISCIIPVGRFLINNWTLTRHLLIVKNLEHFFLINAFTWKISHIGSPNSSCSCCQTGRDSLIHDIMTFYFNLILLHLEQQAVMTTFSVWI